MTTLNTSKMPAIFTQGIPSIDVPTAIMELQSDRGMDQVRPITSSIETPLQVANGWTFFFTEADAIATGKEYRQASYSVYHNDLALAGVRYAEGSVGWLIGCGECDYEGYAVYEGVGLTFNATQHEATPDQVHTGIVNLSEANRKLLAKALTFPAVYCKRDLMEAADLVHQLVYEAWDLQCHANAAADPTAQYPDDSWQNHWYHTPKQVMIGGMPSFMPVLEAYLKEKGWKVGYACTDRVSVDTPQPDGSTRKTSVFKHVGMFWS